MANPGNSLRIFILLLALGAVAPYARAGQNEIEAGTLMSNFVWRGHRQSEGPVYQASVTLGKKGFSFNAWGNYDFRDGRLNETDLTFSYAREIEKITLKAGLIHYAILELHDADEIYAGIQADCLLQPEVTFYYDVNLGKGAFLQGAVGHSVRLAARASLDIKASVAAVVLDGFMGLPDDEREFTGFHNAEVNISCPIQLKDHWTMKMQFGASTPLGSKSRQAIRNSSVWDPEGGSFNGTLVYGGITVLYSF